MHLGNARTALLAWLQARATHATHILRFEDLDRSRVRPYAFDSIRRDLAWLGLDWDLEYVQSQRLEHYALALSRLETYPCTCSKREIGAVASAPHGQEPIYPQTCLNGSAVLDKAAPIGPVRVLDKAAPIGPVRVLDKAAPIGPVRVLDKAARLGMNGTCRAIPPIGRLGENGTFRASPPVRRAGTPAALRWRVPDTVVSFTDHVLGRLEQNLALEVGDFPLKRSDGVYAYHLAVVVDDAIMGVTHVLRGADLLTSTPRQIALQKALEYPTPEYWHVPLMTDYRGERLAKRNGAPSVTNLRESGYSVGALLADLVRSLGWLDVVQLELSELLERFKTREFTLEGIGLKS